MEKRYCDQCGSEIEERDGFCGECGKEYKSRCMPPPVPICSTTVNKQNNSSSLLSKKVIRVLLGIIGLSLCIYGGYQGWSRIQNNDNSSDVTINDSSSFQQVEEEGEYEEYEPYSVDENLKNHVKNELERRVYGGYQGYTYDIKPYRENTYEIIVWYDGDTVDFYKYDIVKDTFTNSSTQLVY